MALLVEFKSDEYQIHMHKWAHWYKHVRDNEPEISVGSGGSGVTGFYKGGKENILRQKQITAKGKPSNTARRKHTYPEGWDTEVMIDKAVRSLRHKDPSAHAALLAQYLGVGTQKSKALELEVSLSLFKYHCAMAQAHIVGFMDGTHARLPQYATA